MVQPISLPSSFVVSRLEAKANAAGILISSLGAGAGLNEEGQRLLLSARKSISSVDSGVRDAILKGLEEVDGAALARRLAPQLRDQLAVAGLSSGGGGLSVGQQLSLISAGLRSQNIPGEGEVERVALVSVLV
ncbi:MAG: hypothetical protein V3V62_06450 [bacterium]